MTGRMSPDRWAAVQERFLDAVDLPEQERTAWLARLEAEDPELAAEVGSLLRAEAQGPLGRSKDEAPDLVAEYVGPYRLIRRLGEGGMGIVFLAEREQAGFRQRVALKLLRSGFLDPRLADQVEHERRVLARLEHPNIARLIDGGATPTGQPFLAMEYIEGDTLLDYVTRNALSLTERIKLFTAVADAVHYAHQQLVVHRDLKPRNVMVDAAGRPRLLDFGISKLLDPDSTSAQATRSSPWLTPSYASPEQIRGEAVSTLSDVYALGLILYELLVGVRPYQVEGRTPAEMQRIICETEPPRPSERARDPRWARVLRGDLDTIVLKALAKEPARRYASAEQLAEDLRRYSTGRPVKARPDSWRYRSGKFIRRHKTSVALVGVALVLLISAVIGVSRQAAIARRERDRAEAALAQSKQVTDYVVSLFQVTDPGQVHMSADVAQGMLRQGVARAEALSGQPLLKASMLDAFGMVFAGRDQFDQAQELVDRAARIRDSLLPADHPDVAASLAHQGRIFRGKSRYNEALQRYQQALAIRLRVLGPAHPEVAASYRDLGFLMPYLSRVDDAVRYYDQALAISRRALGEENPTTAQDMVSLGVALRRAGRLAEGRALLEQAVGLLERVLGPEHPETARFRFYMADALRDEGRFAEAERQYRRGIEARRRAVGTADLGMIHGLDNLADMLGRLGRTAEAEALVRESIAIGRTRLGERSNYYASSLDQLAMVLTRQQRHAEALALERRALEIWREVFGPVHAAVASGVGNYSYLLERAGRLASAEAASREQLAMRLQLYPPVHPLVGLARLRLAAVLNSEGRVREAEGEARAGLRLLEALQPPSHPDRILGDSLLAVIYAKLGRADEAARYRGQAGSGRARAAPDSSQGEEAERR